jgi:hypothetical protein
LQLFIFLQFSTLTFIEIYRLIVRNFSKKTINLVFYRFIDFFRKRHPLNNTTADCSPANARDVIEPEKMRSCIGSHALPEKISKVVCKNSINQSRLHAFVYSVHSADLQNGSTASVGALLTYYSTIASLKVLHQLVANEGDLPVNR